MSVWAEIRKQARIRHSSLGGSSEDLMPANSLLDAAERDTGIKREVRPSNDALLDGAEAVYRREWKQIYFSAATEARLAAFHVAHEYAHHWMDEVLTQCRGDDLNVATPTEPEMSLVGEPDAYSPKERTEAQANLFAREFLLPSNKLRRICRRERFDAECIAADVGVPVDLVMQQLADALLPPEDRGVHQAREEPPPDDTQRKSIEARDGPHRVGAGPGTGKTRTLVGKVKRLVEIGEAPDTILVLTFSNFSAQDLAVRIRAAVGERAVGIWVGTFHAFGLELLRKYGAALDLPVDLRLLDRSGSLMLLEELLPDLSLEHYLELSDPLIKLRSILALIARAKDECASPVRYGALAEAMPGGNDADREARAKALEVAHAYEIYEGALHARGLVDFGDLIARPVELFQLRPDIRDVVRAEKRHVLVDEYQDMNRASGLLLRELVEPTSGPWVVGDLKQSIYRFRGASPINFARFGEDFPGALATDLGVNYRSGGRIIRVFETFSEQMPGGQLASVKQLKANRGATAGRVAFEVATTFEAECEGITRTLRAGKEGGRPFGQHAILARSHTVSPGVPRLRNDSAYVKQ